MMTPHSAHLTILLLLTLSDQALSSWYLAHDDLLSQLLDNYNKDVRPSEDGAALDIDIIANPLFLIRFDERNQVLTIRAIIVANWTDNRLKWNPSSFNNISSLYIPQKKLWLPPLNFAMSVSPRDQLGYDENILTISPDGSVSWTLSILMDNFCEIDVSYYPFDLQHCALTLEFTPMTRKDLNTRPHPTMPMITDHFGYGGIWELEAFGCQSFHINYLDGHAYHSLQYHLNLRRRTTFYLLTVILPVIFLSLISSSVFLLPAESGEKMGVAITILLSYSVYLSVIADSLPQTSSQVCLLQVYLTCLLGITALAVLLSVIVLRIHHRSPDIPVGQTTQVLTIWAMNLLCRPHSVVKSSNSVKPTEDVMPHDDTTSVTKDMTSGQSLQDNGDQSNLGYEIEKDVITQEMMSQNKVTWTVVAETLDRGIFVLISLVIFLGSVCIFTYIVISGSSYLREGPSGSECEIVHFQSPTV